GVPPPAGLWAFDALAAAYQSATEVGYEVVPPDDGQPRKRLVEHKRGLFLADDLASPRAWKKISPLGLRFQSYQLALTAPVRGSLFPISKIPDASIDPMLMTDGLYVHFDDQHGESDEHFWIPSGTVDYLDAQRAPARFYQPAGYFDARGAHTAVLYLGEDPT